MLPTNYDDFRRKEQEFMERRNEMSSYCEYPELNCVNVGLQGSDNYGGDRDFSLFDDGSFNHDSHSSGDDSSACQARKDASGHKTRRPDSYSNLIWDCFLELNGDKQEVKLNDIYAWFEQNTIKWCPPNGSLDGCKRSIRHNLSQNEVWTEK